MADRCVIVQLPKHVLFEVAIAPWAPARCAP
jgi:hypothetical protein